MSLNLKDVILICVSPQGCYDKLHDYLVQNGILIGTVAIVVAVFMVRKTLM